MDADPIALVRRQQVVRPFRDEQLLGVFEGDWGFGLGVPINGEDPVTPATLRREASLRGCAAPGCLSKVPSEVPGDDDPSNCNGGFQGRDAGDKLGQVRPIVDAVGCVLGSVAAQLCLARQVGISGFFVQLGDS